MDLASIKKFFASLTLQKLVPVILIVVIGLLLVKLLLKLFDRVLERSRLERTMFSFLRAAMRTLLYTILVLVAASSLGVDVTSLVAILSVVSLAISLAVQNALSNVVGSVTLLTTHPFHVGDFVEIGSDSGTVEEISNRVAQGLSEIGIVYIAQKQLHQFQHILSHKKLKFVPLDSKEACVYVGPKHPRYHDESIDFQDLSSLSFVRGVRDFFSVEHHLNHVSLGAISTEQLHYAVYTNSDHLTVNLLLNTDICSLGINFLYDQYRQYDVRQLRINNCEPFLLIGYICPDHAKLSKAAEWFICHFKEIL